MKRMIRSSVDRDLYIDDNDLDPQYGQPQSGEDAFGFAEGVAYRDVEEGRKIKTFDEFKDESPKFINNSTRKWYDLYVDTYKSFAKQNGYPILSSDFQSDDEIAYKTPKDRLEFDHDVIWSLEFYNNNADLVSLEKVYVLAKTYAEAREQSEILCEAWGYNPDACIIQYVYRPISFWDRLYISEDNGVVYGEE